jgi:hypothetical protein
MARVCPHCRVTATFTRRWSDSSPSADGDIDPDNPLFFCDTCDNCGNPVCGVYPAGSTLEETPWMWPEAVPRKSYVDVPTAIASTAVEAHQALGAEAPRASAAMARATVEATAKDKGFTRGSLEEKINELAEAGLISTTTRDAAHEIRFAGNEAAHGDIEPISVEEAAEIAELMDAILHRVYQEPAKIARIRASREARTNRQESTQATS